MATSMDGPSVSDLRESPVLRVADLFRTPGRRAVPPPKLDCIIENVSGASSPDRSTRPSALFDSIKNASAYASPSATSPVKTQVRQSPPQPPPPAAPLAPAPLEATKTASRPATPQPSSSKTGKGKKRKKKDTGTPKVKPRISKTSASRRQVTKRSSSGAHVNRPTRRPPRTSVKLPIKKGPAPPPSKGVLSTTPAKSDRDRERDAVKSLSRDRLIPRGWDSETRGIYQRNLVERLAMPKMPHTERVSMSILPGSVPSDLLRTDEEKKIWARWHPPESVAARSIADESQKQKMTGKQKIKGNEKEETSTSELSDTDLEEMEEERANAKKAARVPSHRVARRKKRNLKTRGGGRSSVTVAVSTPAETVSVSKPSSGDGPDVLKSTLEKESDSAKKGSMGGTRSPLVPPKAALHLARITTSQRSKRQRHPATGHLVRPPGTARKLKSKTKATGSAPPIIRVLAVTAPAPPFEGGKAAEAATKGDKIVASEKKVATTLMAPSSKKRQSATSAGTIRRKDAGKVRRAAQKRAEGAAASGARPSGTEAPRSGGAHGESPSNARARLRRVIMSAAKAARTQSSRTSRSQGSAVTRVSDRTRSSSFGKSGASTARLHPQPPSQPQPQPQPPSQPQSQSKSQSQSQSQALPKNQLQSQSQATSVSMPPVSNASQATSTSRAKVTLRVDASHAAKSGNKSFSAPTSKRTNPVTISTQTVPILKKVGDKDSRKSDHLSGSESQGGGSSRWTGGEMPSELVEAFGPVWTNAAESYLRRRGMAREERSSFRSARRTSGASKTLRRLSARLSFGTANRTGPPSPPVPRVRADDASFGMPVALPAVLHPAVGQPLPSSRRTSAVVPKNQQVARVRFSDTSTAYAANRPPDASSARRRVYPSAPPSSPKSHLRAIAHDIKTIKAPKPEQYLNNVSSEDEVPPAGETPTMTKMQRVPPPPTLPRLAALFAATGGSRNNAVRRLVMGGRAARSRPTLQAYIEAKQELKGGDKAPVPSTGTATTGSQRPFFSQPRVIGSTQVPRV